MQVVLPSAESLFQKQFHKQTPLRLLIKSRAEIANYHAKAVAYLTKLLNIMV